MRFETSFLRISSFPACRNGVTSPTRTVAAATPVILMDILQPAVGLAIWCRAIDDGWRTDIRSLATQSTTEAFARGAPEVIVRTLFRRLACGVPAWLAEDVASLAGLLGALANTSRVSARLSTAAASLHETPAPDGLRLCCRYGGRPMLWWDADPSGAGPASGEIDPFSVALIKGAIHPLIRRRSIRLGDAAQPGTEVAEAAGLTVLIEPMR